MNLPSPPAQAPPTNGMAVASLVLGIVGAVMGLVPLTGFIAFICGALAVVFGLVGRRRAVSRGMATAGLILGLIAVGLGIWGMVIVFQAAEKLSEV